MKTTKLVIFLFVLLNSLSLANGTGGKNLVAPESTVAEIEEPSGIKGKGVIPAISPVAAVVLLDDDDSMCKPYIGGGIIYNRVYSVDSGWFDNHVDTQDETGGFAILAGCNFNKYFAVEGRYTWTEWDQDYSDMTSYSIFLKPMYPVTEDITVYGLIGYGNSEVVGSKGDPDNDYSSWNENIGRTMMDHNGFHWGFGAMYDITENISLFGEFTSTADDADIDPTRLYCYNGDALGNGCTEDSAYYDKLSTDGLTVGLIYHF